MAWTVSEQSRIALLYLIFAALLVAGIALSVYAPNLFTIDSVTSHDTFPPQPTSSDFANKAVRVIAAGDEFTRATSTGRCVLFVNCNWNEVTVAFRQPFSEFAAWCEKNNDYKTIAVKLDAISEVEMWSTIQKLWKDNSISPGGLKTYGGAGRVVWFNDGRVVDHAWCIEVFDLDELKSRTKDAFP